MQLTTVIVTRNKSASVKTLHTLLKLNIFCLENSVQNRIIFTNDDHDSRQVALKKNLKNTVRILWIDYGINIDEDSLRQVIAKDWKWHGVVFPCVTEGINWEQFKENIDTSEPLTQKGLSFDTSVTTCVRDSFYKIEKTKPRCFCFDTKPFLKHIKKENMSDFEHILSSNLNLVAYTNAKLIVTYPHECLGHILSAAGVKANKA